MVDEDKINIEELTDEEINKIKKADFS